MRLLKTRLQISKNPAVDRVSVCRRVLSGASADGVRGVAHDDINGVEEHLGDVHVGVLLRVIAAGREDTDPRVGAI